MNTATARDLNSVLREIASPRRMSDVELLNAHLEVETEGNIPKLYDIRLTPDELGHVLSLCLQFGITNPPGSRFYYAENTSAMQKLNNAVVRR